MCLETVANQILVVLNNPLDKERSQHTSRFASHLHPTPGSSPGQALNRSSIETIQSEINLSAQHGIYFILAPKPHQPLW